MATWIWVVIAIAVVVVIALIAAGASKRRSANLRTRFGPEYDRVVGSSDDRRAAEAGLRDRERQRAQFDIKPLPEATRVEFASEWRDLQELFVDQPEEAAAAADALITRVMEVQGYPMKDFDAQADLVSVDHPGTVGNYRFAHAVQQRSGNSGTSGTRQASTEDLREALLRYRSLFDELLRPAGNGAAGATAGSRQRVATGQEAQAPVVSATGQADGPETVGSDGLADPAASERDYHDQQVGQ
jgi:hypothetical protein